MRKWLLIYGCWCCLMMSLRLSAQSIDTLKLHVPDSTRIEKEDQVYQSIETYSRKRGFTKFLYRLLFRSPNRSATPQKPKESNGINFSSSQDKIIRNINIIPLDPFGYDEKDLSVTPQKSIDKWGNALHGKTKRFTIKSQLLFKEEQPLDSLLLKESERLLRSRRYIRRALIQAKEISADSVDVQVTVLDNWSLIADGEFSGSRGRITARERNIFGLGHELSAIYRQKFNENDNGYAIAYRAENLYETYINTTVSYDFGYNDNFEKKWVVERPLFSPYARWAGGVGFYQNRFNEVINLSDRLHRPYLQTNSLDIHGSYAVPVLKNYTDKDKRTNLIFSARYKNLIYKEKPPFYLDRENFFADQDLYIVRTELNRTSYVQDRYIFRHGDEEDVAIGKSIFVSSGYLFQNQKQFPYLGIGFTRAAYTERGYFGISLQAGSLFTEEHTRQTVISGESIYFSKLFPVGDWYIRQFFKTRMTVGINRRESNKDRLTLNGSDGIQGFSSDYVYGTRKLVITSQTQTYSPFDWVGFRISPFLTADLGLIGSDPKPFFKNDVYAKIGLGLYISNDFLAFSSFQIAFCYFPYIPGNGSHKFKLTGIQNHDFRLQNFEHQPPDMVPFR